MTSAGFFLKSRRRNEKLARTAQRKRGKTMKRFTNDTTDGTPEEPT
jgi:hypothetical protein